MEGDERWRVNEVINFDSFYRDSEDLLKTGKDSLKTEAKLHDSIKDAGLRFCKIDSIDTFGPATQTSGNESGPFRDYLETASQSISLEPIPSFFEIGGSRDRIDYAAKRIDAERKVLSSQRRMKRELLEKINRKKALFIARKEVSCLRAMTKKIKTLQTCEALARQIKLPQEDKDDSAGAGSLKPESASEAAEVCNSDLTFSGVSRKRGRNSDHGPISDLEYDDDTRSSRPDLRNQQTSDNFLRLSCPFRKQDPVKYNLSDYPICALSSWSTTARIKEHLYRAHKAPVFCERCKLQFKTSEALKAHLTVPDGEYCNLKDGPSPEGIGSEIVIQLKSRKNPSPKRSEPERWRNIFQLIFPGVPAPQPDFEGVPDRAAQSADTSQEGGFKEYSQRELPRAFRERLDKTTNEQLNSLDDHSKNELVKMVEECQQQLASDYYVNQRTTMHWPQPKDLQKQPPQNELWPSETQNESSTIGNNVQPEEAGDSKQDISQLNTLSYQQADTLRHQHSATPPAMSSELSASFTNPPSCFCIGFCTCIVQPGPRPGIHPPLDNIGMSTTHCEPDWNNDMFDSIWLDTFFRSSSNAGTFLSS